METCLILKKSQKFPVVGGRGDRQGTCPGPSRRRDCQKPQNKCGIPDSSSRFIQTLHFMDLVQEEALVGMLKEMVKSEINSLIC